jgi:hypothetical protein
MSKLKVQIKSKVQITEKNMIGPWVIGHGFDSALAEDLGI